MIKRDEPITVVIGNPPYKIDAAGLGGWVEKGSPGSPSPMDLWAPLPAWGLGAHAKHLKNLYVFFWRWAAWKVLESGHAEATGEVEVPRPGIVCYITAAGFLNGPGFQQIRADLRASCSDIWVIDASPGGHQPAVNTRLFQGVQQEACIVLALRRADAKGPRPDDPRRRHHPRRTAPLARHHAPRTRHRAAAHRWRLYRKPAHGGG